MHTLELPSGGLCPAAIVTTIDRLTDSRRSGMEVLFGIEIGVTFALVLAHLAMVVRDRLAR
jgi:hypothetical protein